MILVTGAAGFIGQHLLHMLPGAVGLDIRRPARSDSDRVESVPWFDCDITDTAAVGRLIATGLKITACVHLAAVASPRTAENDPTRAWATNVLGTHNVLRLAQQCGASRFIFMSSAHVYGISPKYLPTDENHPLALLDTYTTTKILGEKLCELFYANHGLPYTALRLFNAYGPGQSPEYFLGVKLAQAKITKKLTIRNAAVTKDWVHVHDVVRAIRAALESAYVGPLNIGTGTETSLQKIVDTLEALFDLSPAVDEGSDGTGPTHMCSDIRRASSALNGWAPQIPSIVKHLHDADLGDW